MRIPRIVRFARLKEIDAHGEFHDNSVSESFDARSHDFELN